MPINAILYKSKIHRFSRLTSYMMETFNKVYITLLYCYNIIYIYGIHILKYDIIYRRNVQCRKSLSSSLPLIKVDADIIGGRGGGVLFFVAQKLTAEPYHNYYNTHYKYTKLYALHIRTQTYIAHCTAAVRVKSLGIDVI